MRVLVSGSRTWRAPQIIWEDLEECLKEATRLGEEMTLVHGRCRRGADEHADQWGIVARFRRNGGVVIVERCPADWARFPGRAGGIRDRVMVESGIDQALFYIHNDSRGASLTLGLARSAGLRRKVRRRWGDDWTSGVDWSVDEERPIPGLEGL